MTEEMFKDLHKLISIENSNICQIVAYKMG